MKLVVLNHKMNMEYSSLEQYIKDLKKINMSHNKLIVCPSNIFLTKFVDNGFIVGSQNSAVSKNGAYTGEVSALQLKSIGIKYGLVGHSERRNLFGETSEIINKKIRLLLFNDINPILCIGENEKDYRSKSTKKVLLKQLSSALDKISVTNLKKIIIAYEPVWAIGTGTTPTLNEIASVSKYIKSLLLKYGDVDIKVLYGGSVNKNNIDNLEKIPNIDGYLIGGASLNADLVWDIASSIK